MHPTPLDAGYMKRVLAEAARFRVHSFEICGECHNWNGGMEGLVTYRRYPSVAAGIDADAVHRNHKALRDILHLSHATGRSVYLWHREVMAPDVLVRTMPGLLNERGEFDLLGDAYTAFLREKIDETFDAVPDLDGIVLTLTESDYSVIHHADSLRYPPDAVVCHIVSIFAGELEKRGKRFILRSFGSIAKDYEDILAGAALAAAKHQFEIETKITPYDFVPFLPINPFLRPTAGATLGAEYDSVGEFLAAGLLPACNVPRIVGYVRAAQATGVNRHVIRIDRLGCPIFSCSYAVNLFAYHRAIEDAGADAESIVAEWMAEHCPGAGPEFARILDMGMRVVEKAHFIAGNVIFHAFPLDPSLKWVKAGGIFALFKEGVSLEWQSGIWSILSHQMTPSSRRAILEEKDEAAALASDGLTRLRGLCGQIPPALFARALQEWTLAEKVARLIRAFCAVACAYFDDMESGDYTGAGFSAAVARARDLFSAEAPRSQTPAQCEAVAHEAYHDLFAAKEEPLEEVYANPMLAMIAEMEAEFAAESAARRHLGPGASDLLVFGSLTDEWRTRRFMHASHALCKGGRISRQVGNRVFPNGFLEFRLGTPGTRGATIEIEADPLASPSIRIRIGAETVAAPVGDGTLRLPLPDNSGSVEVRIESVGGAFARVFSARTLPASG